MSYRHRRLRKQRPAVVLTYMGPHLLTNEVAARVRQQWRTARDVVVLSGDWRVQEVRR